MRFHHRRPNRLLPSTRWIVGIIVVSTLLIGCATSYRNFPEERRAARLEGPRIEACIRNPDLTREYRILLAAEIYRIHNASDCRSTITLRKMQASPNLLEALGRLVSLFTLGVLPVEIYEAYVFSYQLHSADELQEHHYTIFVRARRSVWDNFRKPFVNEDAIFGRSLRYHYLRRHAPS